MFNANWAPTRGRPRSMVLRSWPTVLPQPKGSSICLRLRWLAGTARLAHASDDYG
jgi:hypothetical protein